MNLNNTRSFVSSAALCLVALVFSTPAHAQDWRDTAAHLGTTARVLLVGVRPAEEDNGLITRLSLGRHLDVAYLSITRGESGLNLVGPERNFGLAAIRTAELLEERKRDGAHQYFTRAYDIGSVDADSLVLAAWPRDSLLQDMATVIRAFRPHVVISLCDTVGPDATRRFVAGLVRQAFEATTDTAAMPSIQTSRLPAWAPLRLFTVVADSAERGPRVVSLNIGEFDRARGRSYAELGAEIRQLQRSSVPVVAPRPGPLKRFLRLDSSRVGNDTTFFGAADTTLGRFRAELAFLPTAHAHFDTLRSMITSLASAAAVAPGDSLAAHLARIARRTSDVRLALRCNDIEAVPQCGGVLGDLAVALNTIRERATPAMLTAMGVAIDGVTTRAIVAEGDSVPATVTVYNGGATPVRLRRLAATAGNILSVLVRDTTVMILADSTRRWSANLHVLVPTYHWWQKYGLVPGTRMHDLRGPGGRPVVPQLIQGEDRIIESRVEATLAAGGVEVPIIRHPLVQRSATMVRGDDRHPLQGVPQVSVLLDRLAEYQRASEPVDRMFRVYVWSARSVPETLAVSLALPKGLRVDSATRVVPIPPFGAANVYFHLQGRIPVGPDTVFATAHSIATIVMSGAPTMFRPALPVDATFGIVSSDFPHIPTQQYVRFAYDRLQAVDVRVPPKLRVLYVKGSDDVPTSLAQLHVPLQSLEPSLIPIVDLSGFTTILVGSDALANEAVKVALPAIREFARRGGTVVVLPNADVGRSGLLPYPMDVDSTARVADPASVLELGQTRAMLLSSPNEITTQDFVGWVVERARDLPVGVDSRYRTVMTIGDPGRPTTDAALLWAPFGKGVVIYSALALDQQLAATQPGAARLMINLLSAGIGAPTRAETRASGH